MFDGLIIFNSTSSKLLGQLSQIYIESGTYMSDSYLPLSVAIASNPNTSVHVLKKLYKNAEVIAGAPLGTMDYSNCDWDNIKTLKTAIKSNPNWQKALTQ